MCVYAVGWLGELLLVLLLVGQHGRKRKNGEEVARGGCVTCSLVGATFFDRGVFEGVELPKTLFSQHGLVGLYVFLEVRVHGFEFSRFSDVFLLDQSFGVSSGRVDEFGESCGE